MLCIRFTPGEGCDVHASPAELRAVAENILALAAAGRGVHSFAADTSISPEPYDRVLSQLVVRVTNGPVCATVDGDMLIVEAGEKFLTPFASFFNFPDDAPHGAHHHHEYFEGEDYISPNSTALVIMVGPA